jgi:hypothetical protein
VCVRGGGGGTENEHTLDQTEGSLAIEASINC